MANYWVRKGWEVIIVTLSGRQEPPFYDLDAAVRHVPMGISGVSRNALHGLASNVRRVWVLRRTIAEIKPDAVISFMDTTNVLAILATRGLGIPTLVSERNNPAFEGVRGLWPQLRRVSYRIVEGAVTQTERARACFPATVRDRCAVIPNPVLSSSPTPYEGLVIPHPSLLAVGRLSVQKGFDLLLAAFARLGSQYPDWHLVIVGEGPLRTELEARIAELGILDRVQMPGHAKDPVKALRDGDIFVLSSRYEGFPNALCEAMSAGMPVVSFDCPFGPAEIIRDGVDGVLVPNGDLEALVGALGKLMADADLRGRLSARATDVVERFSLEKVMGAWEQLLGNVIG